MKRVAALFSALVGCCSVAFCADPKSPPPPYQLKNKSSFAVDPTRRAPFWPIGWTKTATVAKVGPVVAKPAFQIQPNHFRVTTILLSHPPLATINDRAFGEGDLLPVVVAGTPVRVVVKAIRDGGVWLDQSGHQIFVPIKREIIPNRMPTQETKSATPEFQIRIEDKPAK